MNEANNKKTKFICIEGIDGSGKKMQTTLLADKLRMFGHNVELIDFPRYDSFFGKETGAHLSGKGGASSDIHDVKMVSILYAMDRWDHMKSADLSSVDYVIFDRFTLSNAAYQSARVPAEDRFGIIDWIFELEHEKLSLPVPDLYIFLDVPPEISRKLTDSKGYRDYIGIAADVYEQNFELQRNVRAVYIEMAERLKNVRMVSCIEQKELLAPELILGKVLELVQSLS